MTVTVSVRWDTAGEAVLSCEIDCGTSLQIAVLTKLRDFSEALAHASTDY